MKKCLLLVLPVLITMSAIQAQQRQAVPGRFKQAIPQLMERDRIPGMSIAWINKGTIEWMANYGVANAGQNNPVTDSTLFEAASLSKVVTAYAALKLVEIGSLDLDKPLNTYLGNNYDAGSDQRINQITARMVLSHSAGFPNWRSQSDTILPIFFNPGERFNYSGEGFVYLARVMEKITGMSYTEVIAKTVFAPLGMKQSSMVFLPALKERYAWRHSWVGKPSGLADYPGANAAASLRTTARDYAVFLAAVLTGKGLKTETHQEMLHEQIRVDKSQPALAWGLGIGLELNRKKQYGWHWGDQGDAKAFFMADIKTGNALVYFTNSANGLSIAPDLVAIAFGNGEHDILKFVAYGKFDPVAVRLYENVEKSGAAPALEIYNRERTRPIGEETLNSLGYDLLRNKKNAEAILIFLQNTKDYPNSANVWDSLAEGYMENGDKQQAIQYYEKSLVLNPQNSNAKDQLKKLRQ
ncbi:MAG: serine hydrolase [Chitinophagaceae bacterium]